MTKVKKGGLPQVDLTQAAADILATQRGNKPNDVLTAEAAEILGMATRKNRIPVDPTLTVDKPINLGSKPPRDLYAKVLDAVLGEKNPLNPNVRRRR